MEPSRQPQSSFLSPSEPSQLSEENMNSETKKRLCQLCSDLRLTRERFRVTRSERSWDDNPGGDSSSSWIASGTAPVRYEIAKTSRECPLCDLIRRTIKSYLSGKNLDSGDEVTEFLVEWDLDGPYVQDLARFANTSRRLKVSWIRKERLPGNGDCRGQGNGKKTERARGRKEGDDRAGNGGIREEIYLLSADPPLPQQRIGSVTGETGTSSPEVELVLSPRPQAPVKEYEGSESLILKWLRMCETTHHNPHPLSRGEWRHQFRSLVSSTYFGVIDVVEKRLCSLPMEGCKPAPYVALSYVWGDDKQSATSVNKHKELRTTSENVMSRIEHMGLASDWAEFPRTIRDALKLVEDLGRMRKDQGHSGGQLRYIWIDSLCIVQDRPRSWNFNAKNMHLIYGNAHFTICAADGPNPDTGLLALSPKDKKQPHLEWITPDVRVMVSKSSESVINASEWNRRGWTFQERILSRRCVIFTGARVYFQCRQTNWSQDDDPSEAGNGMASAWRILLHRAYEDLEHRPIRFYMTAVETYTGRNLSLAGDILDAFGGVSQLMEWYLCSHFHFGLPVSHLDLALLWKPLAGKSRRTNLPPSCRGHGRDDVEFPSWAWCGWMDSGDPGKGAGVVYDTEFLGGFLSDIRDWLLNHTWIVWYVRDQEGNPRPLWEGPTVPPSNRGNVAFRWRGYKSRPRRGSDWVKHLDVEENRAAGEGVDDYGRPPKDCWWRRRIMGEEQGRFTKRLPDNPFGVRQPDLNETKSYMFFSSSSSSHGSHGNNDYMSFGEVGLGHQPYQPILQFFTFVCEFHVVRDHDNAAGNALRRFHIADNARDRCGTVVVDKCWADSKQNGVKDGDSWTFIALSEAKDFTKEEGGNSWTHYVPSARDDSEWCLFYVMAIKKDRKRGVWERVGLGKAFQYAFQNASCRWEEILLG